MIDYTPLFETLERDPRLSHWCDRLRHQLPEILSATRHGDYPRWRAVLDTLPRINASRLDFNSDAITIGAPHDCNAATRQQIHAALKTLRPWRKGPYAIHGIHIDTEWRSDWKWQRLAPHIQNLAGRTVLDVGCGSGYHCWRMAGAGARLVIGIDPSLLFTVQFHAVKHFAGPHNVFMLPLGIGDLPTNLNAFDTVFSMGVLYHRRSPIDHLLELKQCLKPGGELVLETLVIDGDAEHALVPQDRYAQMRNVWFIPSGPGLERWLARCGYTDIRLVDVSATTSDEQRTTQWMPFDSLENFLMPGDPGKTIEGHPAPKRATLIASAP